MHLVVAITPHGLGHAAQVAPVLNTLWQQRPDLRLTLMTSVPERFLSARVRAPFRYEARAPDFGLHMNSALEIDLPRSAQAYRRLHQDWPVQVAEAAAQLAALEPDLVLADVPYVPLAAAQVLSVPAVALCSLNWADIYRHYFGSCVEAAQVLAQMQAAYRSARAFLCPEPSMPMPWLARRRSLDPIAQRGHHRREELNDRLGLDPGDSLVLVAPGGVSARFPVERWPRRRGVNWLLAACWRVEHPNAYTIESTGMDFIDLLASADALLGKCGYGTVTECVVNGTPLLFVPRADWPEERWLRAWLLAHHAGVAVPAERLDDGELLDALAQCRATPVRSVAAQGAAQAAAHLDAVLTGVTD